VEFLALVTTARLHCRYLHFLVYRTMRSRRSCASPDPIKSPTTTRPYRHAWVSRQAKLDKLDALLAQSFTPRQDAALFAEMLSLPNDGRYPTLELAPEQKSTEDA
jgi:hypothetical protein